MEGDKKRVENNMCNDVELNNHSFGCNRIFIPSKMRGKGRGILHLDKIDLYRGVGGYFSEIPPPPTTQLGW